MTNETRKIWDTPDVMAMATCIRVPVMRAHAESINLEFEDDITEDEARELLAGAAGVSIIDDRCARLLPPPPTGFSASHATSGQAIAWYSRRHGSASCPRGDVPEKLAPTRKYL